MIPVAERSSKMLVLTRKNHESVVVGDHGCLEHVLAVTVLDIKRGKVRLGFEAHGDVPVYRSEVWQRVCGNDPSEYELPAYQGPKAGDRVSASSLRK
jgi:carbon storage regulator